MDRIRDKIVSLRENGEERTQTNKPWTYFCIVFLTLVVGLVLYCAVNGDTNRILNGYDECGNACGSKNDFISKIPECRGGKDYRNFPKQNLDASPQTCVDKCRTDQVEVFNRCFKSNRTQEDFDGEIVQYAIDLTLAEVPILLVGGLAIVFSYILLLMFRYIIDYVIIFVCVVFVAIQVIVASMLWYDFKFGNCDDCMSFAIVFTVSALITVLVLFLIRNKIKFVGQIFKEASKALIDVPALMFQPVLTFMVMLVTVFIFGYFFVITLSSGDFVQVTHYETDYLLYKTNVLEPDGFTIAGIILNIVAFIWFLQFIIGCQHFIIAGTISKWYFTRDKNKLNRPIATATYNLVFYHLGSICIGSWIITIIKIMRVMLTVLCNKNSRNPVIFVISRLVECIMQVLEDLLKYLVRNSYILVAKDGTPFIQSGRRASELILNNFVNVISLNYIGDLVLMMGRIYVVLTTGFVGYQLMNGLSGVSSIVFPMVVACLISMLIVNCFVEVFEMTLDTIFLCYCVDCEENDGSDEKPYYMSPKMRRLMDELKEGGDNNKMRFQSLNETNA